MTKNFPRYFSGPCVTCRQSSCPSQPSPEGHNSTRPQEKLGGRPVRACVDPISGGVRKGMSITEQELTPSVTAKGPL